MTARRLFSRLAAGALAAVSALALAAAPASAACLRGDYLALGDSVVFGYRPPAVTSPATYQNPANFTGYPEILASWRSLHVANASCPGETTASMTTAGAQSNGCENSVGSPGGYRVAYPLHVSYSGTQLGYAVQFLRSHHDTRLVTLTLGANDLFICQATTPDQCTGTDFTTAVTQVSRNLTSILATLRDKAHYRGELVVVPYYSLNYSDATQVAHSLALDKALSQAARRFHGDVADSYTLFERASRTHHGDPCAAGLLIPLPTGGCDIHPTATGQRLLATATAQAR